MAAYTSTLCQTNASGFFLQPPKYVHETVIGRSAAFTFTTSASSGDVVQMVNVPKGCQVHDVILCVNGGLATGSNLAFNVGDGNATGRYVTSGSLAAATGGGMIFRTNSTNGYSYSAEDTIDVVVGTVGSMSGQMAIRLTVFYSMDQSTDGNS
jgi:hypothetical protein